MSSASVLAMHRETSRGSDLPQARLERVFADQHAVVWRMLRRFGLPAEKAAEGTQWIFANASSELAGCAPGEERVPLLGVALRMIEAYRQAEARASRGRRVAGSGTGVFGDIGAEPPRAEPGHSGVVHAVPLRAQSAPADMMDRVLLRMTRASATVFFLYELEGLSLAETSGVMSMDEASTLGLLTQARQEFRAIAAELSEATRRS